MRYSKKKVMSVFLALCLTINVFAVVPTLADSEDKSDMKITIMSDKNSISPGDTVTITVGVKDFNCKQKDCTDSSLTTFSLYIPIDTDNFEFVEDSIAWTDDNPMKFLNINTHVAYNSYEKEVRIATLAFDISDQDYDEFNVFSFKVKAKERAKLNTVWDLSNVSTVVLGCSNSKYGFHYNTKLETNSVKISNGPIITLNGNKNTNQTYKDSVVVDLREKTADSIIKINGDSVKLPYTAKKNGKYSVVASDKDGRTTIENFEINMPVTSIKVTSLPKDTYIQEKEDVLDLSAGKLEVTYTNNEKEIIPLDKDMCSGYNLKKAGTQSVTVNYQGKTTQFNITVEPTIVSSISVKKAPFKTEYDNGSSSLDLTGGVINVEYNNGKSESVDMSKAEYTLPDMTTYGKKDVIITYEGKTTSYEITIKKTVKRIEVATMPTNNTFTEGTKLNLAGGLLNVIYDDSTKKVVSLDKAEVTYDNNTVGNQNAKVTYSGKTTTFPIEVKAKELTKISIATSPKINYKEGDVFTVAGGVIEAVYNNGTSQKIDITMAMVSPASPDMTPSKTAKVITITYGGITTTYQYTVAAKEITGIKVSAPDKVTYVEETNLDVTGGKVKLIYDNKTTETINLSEGMCSGFDNTRIGSQDVTVTYGEFTDSFTVTIKEKSVTNVVLKSEPAKLNYIEGQKVDVTGGLLTVTYDNGTIEDKNISDDMIIGFDTNKIGRQNVTVSLGGKKVSFTVTVKQKELTGISIGTEPNKSFIEKTTFSVINGKLRLYFDNGLYEDIDMTTDMCTGYNMDKIGNQKIKVSYKNKTTSYTINVREKSLASISVSTMPSVTTILEGKQLDVSDGILTLTYDNGETSTIKMNNSMVSDFDSTIVGNQKANITYQEKTTVMPVTVKAKSVTEIVLVSKPKNKEVIEGLQIDLTGVKIKVLYNNDTNTDIDVTSDIISGFNNTKLGTQTITVTYQDKTVTFDVILVPKSLESIELKSITGDEAVLAGKNLESNYKVYTNYNNNTSEEISLSDVMISGFNKDKLGEQTVKLSYDKMTLESKISVLSLDKINDVNTKIAAINVDSLTSSDKDSIETLVKVYNSLTTLERNEIKNADMLAKATQKIASLTKEEIEKPSINKADNTVEKKDSGNVETITEKNVSANTKSPTTGDSFGAYKYLMIAISAELVIGILIFKKKKFIEDEY